MLILKKIDFFSTPPIILVNENNGYKSFSGGINTILISIAFIISSVIIVDEYFNSANNSELKTTEKLKTYSPKLNLDNFFIAFYVTTDNPTLSYSLNETQLFGGQIIYHPRGFLYEHLPIDHYFYNVYPFGVNCSLIDFRQYLIDDDIKKELIEKAICINMNDTILNYYSTNSYDTLEYAVTYNLTYNKEIGDLLPGVLNSHFFYSTLYTSPSRFNEIPVKREIEVQRSKINTNNYYKYIGNIKTSTVIKKGDSLRGNTQNSTFLEINNLVYIQEDKHDEIDPIYTRVFSLQLTLDIYKSVYILSYPTFFNSISQLGGILSFIFSAIQLCLGWIGNYEQIHYLFHHFFDPSNEIIEIALRNEHKGKNIQVLKNNFTSNNSPMQINIKNNINNKIILNNNPNEVVATENKSNINISTNLINENNQNLNNLSNNQNSFNASIRNIRKIKINPLNGKLIDLDNQSTESKNKIKKKLGKLFSFMRNNQIINSFILQKYLGLENLLRLNKDWTTFKYLMLSQEEIISLKYINFYKLYSIEEIDSQEQSSFEKYTMIKSYLQNNSNKGGQFGKVLFYQKFVDLIKN